MYPGNLSEKLFKVLLKPCIIVSPLKLLTVSGSLASLSYALPFLPPSLAFVTDTLSKALICSIAFLISLDNCLGDFGLAFAAITLDLLEATSASICLVGLAVFTVDCFTLSRAITLAVFWPCNLAAPFNNWPMFLSYRFNSPLGVIPNSVLNLSTISDVGFLNSSLSSHTVGWDDLPLDLLFVLL